MSDSVRPHRQQPTRLPRPWDSLGKNTGVDCHFLLQCMKVKSESELAQSCPTLGDPMDCSPPGSSIHGIFQARVLEWGAIVFSNFIPSIFKISDLCSLYKRSIQYACCLWATLVAQMVKNPPAMWKVLARPLGWEDPLEEAMATHSSILAI